MQHLRPQRPLSIVVAARLECQPRRSHVQLRWPPLLCRDAVGTERCSHRRRLPRGWWWQSFQGYL